MMKYSSFIQALPSNYNEYPNKHWDILVIRWQTKSAMRTPQKTDGKGHSPWPESSYKAAILIF